MEQEGRHTGSMTTQAIDAQRNGTQARVHSRVGFEGRIDRGLDLGRPANVNGHPLNQYGPMSARERTCVVWSSRSYDRLQLLFAIAFISPSTDRYQHKGGAS